jgi:hypothetical protein
VPPEITLYGRKNKKGWENEEKLVRICWMT